MSYLGVFSATLLALAVFKFMEPWIDALRNKIMGWDKEETSATD